MAFGHIFAHDADIQHEYIRHIFLAFEQNAPCRDGSRSSNIQGRTLCDNRDGHINYYHKELHLGCCSSPISALPRAFFYEILMSTFMVDFNVIC